MEKQCWDAAPSHFQSHYPSHSLRFTRSPLLSLEVSDTETGNNQKSAGLMPHEKHQTPHSFCTDLADRFRAVAVIPMCIFPLLKFSDSQHSLWHAWQQCLLLYSFPLDIWQTKSHCFNLCLFFSYIGWHASFSCSKVISKIFFKSFTKSPFSLRNYRKKQNKRALQLQNLNSPCLRLN